MRKRQRVVKTHWAVCSVCGHPQRLVTETLHEFVSQCFVCGDAVTNPLIQQLSLGLHERDPASARGADEAIA